jgi:hypothetical protein
VDDALLVQVGKSIQDLPKYFPFSLLLLSPRVVLQKMLQGLALAVLHLDVKNADTFARSNRLLICLVL